MNKDLCFPSPGIVRTNCNQSEIKHALALKVIPLKFFYYQTFLKLGVINIHDMNTKKKILKKWAHRACLHASELLIWGAFPIFTLKIRITFI